MAPASWALVKWEEDGRFTVVPAGWGLTAPPIPIAQKPSCKQFVLMDKKKREIQSHHV